MSVAAEAVIDAVLKDLETYTFATPVEIKATFKTRMILQDVAQLKSSRLSVVLQDIKDRFVCRNARAKTFVLDLVLQKKVSQKESTRESCGLVSEVEGLMDYFTNRTYPEIGICRRCTTSPVYSTHHMDAYNAFTGVLTIEIESITLRGSRE